MLKKSPNWSSVNSTDLKQGDIIIVSMRGIKYLSLVLVDATYPFITIPLLIDSQVRIVSLLNKEKRLNKQ